MTAAPERRRQQLADGLAAVRARIAAAAASAGRSPAELTLVVVTKFFPAADVRLLAALGVRQVGENKDQEAAAKAAQCADLGLDWHFIGQLQTNKARSVARYAALVHTVDRDRLVGALGRAARAQGRRLGCLVQVSLDGDPARGGVPTSGVGALAERVLAEDGLELRGLMAVAPLGADPGRAFAVLPELSVGLQMLHEGADIVSAGMSGDLEAAISSGATHLRVGSAVLGQRPLLGYRRDGG